MENKPEEEVKAAEVREDEAMLFIKEYGELVEKHQMDFATYPVFQPDGQAGFRVIVQNTPVSIKNQPKKSPFVATE